MAFDLMAGVSCRCCGATLTESLANLGMSPLANSFVHPDHTSAMEPFFPLHALVCSDCRLVQLAEFETPKAIFSDYLYFSSVSPSWVDHARRYAAAMIERFGLGAESQVVEIASNDGYLLQWFAARGMPVLGVDPAANVAAQAIARGIPTEVAFFGAATARRLRANGKEPVLMVANNVLAHVPDIHDFIEGFRIMLAPGGVATFEFPHLLRLMQLRQFDTIYHEHFSYLSLLVAELLLHQHGLAVFDLEELPSHGGSLRLFVRHQEDATKPEGPAVQSVRNAERAFGLHTAQPYADFAAGVMAVKCDLLDFLITAKRCGQLVAGYGAPAKGNTLLNYCGIGPDLLPFTVDLSPHKQGLLLPGTRIPVLPPDAILQDKPDFVLILPWNLRQEITQQMRDIRAWGGRFVVPIPELQVF